MYPVRGGVCHQYRRLDRARCLHVGLQLTKGKEKRRYFTGDILVVGGQEERHFGGEEGGER